MEKHAPSSCPRCGKIFVCKANNIHQCDCQSISMTFEENQYIREMVKHDETFLCLACLNELKDEFKT
ncbi:hypothetical protein Emtol_1387 [Emticicia oligotrophica DSM 17448]|uniref:Cysteine-rich CWC n=1 Tax=Emticicia oligotrophica (strain DSM 17448 / CIP 109782 / MTCC 6937 / GPTSA100-15) TaxID=929562 RepID=A0ABM5MZV4_EMTOG|nr:hypothetical protein Emtol_1387 [Emticicia oligotrophica DSM 17448]